MEAYAYVLEQLRSDDFHRLRSYASDGRSKFTTWLVVVARRLCLDCFRRRYGRSVGDGPASRETRVTRRRLVDLVADDLDPSALADTTVGNPDSLLRADELRRALVEVVAALSASDRLLLQLRFEHGLAAREIGQLMAFPTPFHVYRRLNTVLDRLRTALGRRGVKDSEP